MFRLHLPFKKQDNSRQNSPPDYHQATGKRKLFNPPLGSAFYKNLFLPLNRKGEGRRDCNGLSPKFNDWHFYSSKKPLSSICKSKLAAIWNRSMAFRASHFRTLWHWSTHWNQTFSKEKYILDLWADFCGRFAANIGYIQFVCLFIYFALFYVY